MSGESLADIFGSCIRSLINELPDFAGVTIVDSILPSLVLSVDCSKLVLDASLDVLSLILTRRFDIDFVRIESICESLIGLVDTLRSSSSKRAAACLGLAVGYCEDSSKIFSSMFKSCDFCLLVFLNNTCKFSSKQILPYLSNQVVPRVWKIASERNDELVEMIIHLFTKLFIIDGIELWLDGTDCEAIVKKFSEWLDFYPNRVSGTVVDTEEWGDDEDTSWKVRLAVAQCVAQIRVRQISPWGPPLAYRIEEIFLKIFSSEFVCNAILGENEKVVIHQLCTVYWYRDLKNDKVELVLNKLGLECPVQVLTRGENVAVHVVLSDPQWDDLFSDLLSTDAICVEKSLDAMIELASLPKISFLLQFLNACSSNLLSMTNFVFEIDLGAFKQKTDLGEGIRSKTKQLIDSLFEQITTYSIPPNEETRIEILQAFKKCNQTGMLKKLADLGV